MLFARSIMKKYVGNTSIGWVNMYENKFKNRAECKYFVRLWGWLRRETQNGVQRLKNVEIVKSDGIYRTQQTFRRYRNIWNTFGWLRKNARHGLSLGAIGISAFDWSAHRIRDTEMEAGLNELRYVDKLRRETLICRTCHRRRLVTTAIEGVRYCECGGESCTLDDWSPFLEQEDLVVWRRPHGTGYEYKLFGEYDDVTAEAFIHVQLDTEYRQRWDESAVELQVVDTDPETPNSHLVYWQIKWPRFFANRDYVFVRRHLHDPESGTVTVISRSIEHPDCPTRRDAHRVTEYESCLVVRPFLRHDEPGIQFSLTYYDESGVGLPSTVTGWIAAAGMPNFLEKLRAAARDYVPTLISHTTQNQSTTISSTIINSNDSSYLKKNYYPNLTPPYC